MRVLAATLAIAGVGVIGSARGAVSVAPTVSCSDIVGQAKSAHDHGYRRVLGTVSVPPAFLRRTVATHETSWPYWRKAGVAVRAGRAPVTIKVPNAWRQRAAITWGSNLGIVSTLRIAACPSPANAWNAYAGGFYIRSSSACVPLTFQVGRHTRTVRFGLGRRCRASR